MIGAEKTCAFRVHFGNQAFENAFPGQILILHFLSPDPSFSLSRNPSYSQKNRKSQHRPRSRNEQKKRRFLKSDSHRSNQNEEPAQL